MMERPAYPTVNADGIPHELIDEQWTAWRWAWREGKNGQSGKWTKPPISPRTGKGAEADNPETWVPFEEACLYTQRRRVGIGRFFHAGDPYFGIDLDKCRDPETGIIAEWALKVIEAFGTYAEPSVSGTGMHLIGRGQIRGDRRRTGQVEMYDSERYFTFTGQPLVGYEHITDCQEALNAFYAETFPEKPAPAAPRSVADLSLDNQDIVAAADRINPKFHALWNGDASGYPSHSEARSALIYILAGYTKDPLQLEDLFQSSGLYREDKWPRERDRLISAALRDVTWQYEPPHPRAPQTATSAVAAASQPTNSSVQATDSDGFVGSTDGQACAAELAMIAQLQQDLEAMTAERNQLQSRYTELERRHSNMTQLLMNPNLTPTEAIAAVLVLSEIERKQAAGKLTDDGRCPIYLDEIAKAYTSREETTDPETGHPIVVETVVDKPRLSKATISRALDKFDEWGMIEKTVVTPRDQPRDQRSGPPKTELYVRPIHQTTRETMRVMASYNPSRIDPETGREKRHGGSLPKDQRPFRCEAHPNADVVLKTEAWCADCGDFLGTISTETMSAAPAFQDETGSEPSTPAPVEDVPMGSNVKRAAGRSHPHRAPAPVHHETQPLSDLCTDCHRPLRNAEERVFGRHDYDCTAATHPQYSPISTVPIAAGGDD